MLATMLVHGRRRWKFIDSHEQHTLDSLETVCFFTKMVAVNQGDVGMGQNRLPYD